MIDSPTVSVEFMSLFLDHLWIWIVLTFAVGVCGYSWYLNNQKGRNLIIAVLAPILTLALGLTLYYGVDTDRKSIARMLNALIVAIERDDVEAVHQFISPRAEDIRQLASRGMRFICISRARYHNLEIEINDATSPPTARVRFNAMFYWRNKHFTDGISVAQPIPERAQFEIELVKTRDRSWLLTGNFQHRLRYAL